MEGTTLGSLINAIPQFTGFKQGMIVIIKGHKLKKINSFLSGISLIALMTSCAQREGVADKSPKPKKGNTHPEISLLNDNAKFKRFAEACISTESTTSTSYGAWYLAKECSLPISTSPQQFIKIKSFHKSNNGDIDGLQIITVKPEILAILRSRYSSGTHNSGKTCAKLGQNTLPILTLVKANLCDALTYNQI